MKKIECPSCLQGWVQHMKVVRTKKEIYLCDECENIWFHKDTIEYSTANYFSQYMAREGLQDLWTELEYLDNGGKGKKHS